MSERYECYNKSTFLQINMQTNDSHPNREMDQHFLLDPAQNVVNEAETLKIENACLKQELANKDRLIEALRSQNSTLAEN